LLHMAYEIDPNIRMFSVDTGRLPSETFELIEAMRDRYPGLQLDLLSPKAAPVNAMVGKHGPNLFYRSVENRLLCCQVRKVLPLQQHLAGLDAWITGLRRDQWATRSDIRKVEIDHDHGAIVKFNPLAEWTEDEVWDYVCEHDLPYNSLYDKGYTSIGCAPCTRPTQRGEDLRAGRWWWETGGPRARGSRARGRRGAVRGGAARGDGDAPVAGAGVGASRRWRRARAARRRRRLWATAGVSARARTGWTTSTPSLAASFGPWMGTSSPS